MMPDNSRRSFLKRSGAALTTLGLAGCIGGGDDGAISEDNPLTLSIVGGIFQDMYEKHIVNPFVEESDVPMKTVPQEGAQAALQKHIQSYEAGEAPVDLVLNTSTSTLLGANSGIWHGWSDDDFSSLEYYNDDYVYRNDDGDIVGTPSQGDFTTIAYHTETFDAADVNTWEIFWDSEFGNTLGAFQVPDASYFLEITAETHFDGVEKLSTKDGIDEVFEKLAEIKPQINFWFDSEASFQERVRTGETPAGQLYNDITQVLKDDGEPVETAWMQEGAVMQQTQFSMLGTSEKVDAAREFLDYAMQPEVMDRLSRNLFTAPLVKPKHSTLSDDLYEKIAGPGPDEAIHPNFDLYASDLQEYIFDEWNKIVIES